MRIEEKVDLLNEAVLIEVFEVYHQKVYSYIYYRINNQSVAEDLTSQVFEKVIKNRKSYSKEKAPIEVWVFTIARNTLNNYFREQKRHRFTSLESVLEMVSSKESPEEKMLREERNSKLYKSLQILNEREKNIVTLKFGAALTNVEIAQIMELTESNVGSILYRSMKKLKVEMEKEDVICLRNA